MKVSAKFNNDGVGWYGGFKSKLRLSSDMAYHYFRSPDPLVLSTPKVKMVRALAGVDQDFISPLKVRETTSEKEVR